MNLKEDDVKGTDEEEMEVLTSDEEDAGLTGCCLGLDLDVDLVLGRTGGGGI